MCATPIGDLADCSYRLISTLTTVDLVACEDTRVTQTLLSTYNISSKLIALEKFSESRRIKTILRYLDDGKAVALVSDAGTPAISDPGARLVRAARDAGHRIGPIPGPSAVTALLSIAGISSTPFVFGGFFPRRPAEAKRFLDCVSPVTCPIVFYESGKRLLSTLTWLQTQFPSVIIGAAKELTKQHERFFQGDIEAVLSQLKTTSLKGEWCFYIHPTHIQKQDPTPVIDALRKQGLSNKQIQYIGTQYLNFKRNDLYPKLQENPDHD